MNHRGGAGLQLCQPLMCCPLVCGLLTDAIFLFYPLKLACCSLRRQVKRITRRHTALFFLTPLLCFSTAEPLCSCSHRVQVGRQRHRERASSQPGVDPPHLLCLFFLLSLHLLVLSLNYCLVFENCPASPPHIHPPRSMWEP